VTGASSGAQEDAMKAEAKVQDLQGRLKIAEQEKAAAEKAQKVRPYAPRSVYYKTHNCTWNASCSAVMLFVSIILVCCF
jgi:hypothetical protein